MNSSLILRTGTRALVPVFLLVAILVLLRGHNEPGGGFIGGLLAAICVALYEKAFGVDEARRWLRLPPMTIAGIGLAAALLGGLWGVVEHGMFLTGVWPLYEYGPDGWTGWPVGSVLLFDTGVFLVVVGVVAAILFALEEAGIPEDRPEDGEEHS
ncbi:MnhB domain-containing protein [Pontivivens insulae]|uniref:Na(+)/H(+) antiporter subunit B n=1 Tax=Pontivivens insulae TaxID=1639689 RepID=A0A2R8A669_9RHOB|nr:MnhB domain-containing protein [Pontivivens insulae]RED17839.1 multisubunit sodium/proton antiporter MrpB subunit [Pontivivens insulae]SPF27729.1 Na(+)/H(+) antiporter subunit B [Pontivivens insulae]